MKRITNFKNKLKSNLVSSWLHSIALALILAGIIIQAAILLALNIGNDDWFVHIISLIIWFIPIVIIIIIAWKFPLAGGMLLIIAGMFLWGAANAPLPDIRPDYDTILRIIFRQYGLLITFSGILFILSRILREKTEEA